MAAGGDLHGSSLEFVKVYLPDHSRQRLLLPPAFSRHMKGYIPTKAVLEDIGGNQWHVDVEKTENGVWFGKGWNQFATDSHLLPGNFLLFQFDGYSLFEVKIYRNDGCMEMSGAGNKRGGEALTLEGTSNVGRPRKSKSGVIISPTHLYFTCAPRPASCFVWLPRRIVKVIGPKLRPIMVFRDQYGETSQVNIIGRFKGRLGFGKGLKEFVEKHPLGSKEEYLLEFSLDVNGGLRKIIDVRIQEREI